ncbi:MAG: methylated-DNA--[protein]-cysteine S-methyltransferase [Alteromonadaceae bacterium]|nr:methylated-DNA--[protein]-cysteine S-methyltransferase [Alteromonadaceae bacterium]
MYFTYYQSPFGDISLTANDQGLMSLEFIDGDKNTNIPLDYQQLNKQQTIFADVYQQLDQYFAKQRVNFNLKLVPQGTKFQQQVWQALTTIKQGETKSYAWLANTINNPKAVRAVGSANGANPIALIIPCHRVIGTNGKLTGYAGGLALKAKLLEFEGAKFKTE